MPGETSGLTKLKFYEPGIKKLRKKYLAKSLQVQKTAATFTVGATGNHQADTVKLPESLINEDAFHSKKFWNNFTNNTLQITNLTLACTRSVLPVWKQTNRQLRNL